MSGPLAMLSRLPVTFRIPLLVSLLMIVLSAVISERVLSRLAETQARHLRELGEAYLEGLSPSLIPAVLRDDVWEVFDTLDRARGLYPGLRPTGTVVTGMNGNVLAASDPQAAPTRSTLSAAFEADFPQGGGLRADEDSERAYLRRDLVYQDRTIGAIYVVIDTSPLIAERREVLATLLATNAVVTLLLAGFGYVVVNRMVQPIRVVTDHLRQGSSGSVASISERTVERSRGETKRLFGSYNNLVAAVREREVLASRLAEEERLASLGRLASGMAHEINNPLGGLFTALDTLKHHGETPTVRMRTLDLLERGLAGIRDVVRSALVSYRAGGEFRPLRPTDIDDLRLLVGPEVERRDLTLRWSSDIDSEVSVKATAVRQAVLNLLLNACAASPPGTVVSLSAEIRPECLVVTVDDSGPGLPATAAAFLTAPEVARSPMDSGAGLGLWLVRRLANELGASIQADRSDFGGARVSLQIPYVQEPPLALVA
ncbi:HAMP domain-containing sensor histidine kinase [Aurantimonas sp. C2-6-R+9]|uniref:sensor histidine kinase n=1 Tax=unclassified Aurantimonas TaxID=2638230 RepID=UPI002E1858DE|nr:MULTISPECIES: HAMP domain-containing sensor histidine kinase [unclassified Aurantimonas]MEC5292885.1 HAMP domain-containing sensor histidine kinase [Aurantimonas sp. C2-3-R2]MEC5383110.1 HAMP domain-containing sensor histidine kinase [Aurantimonas sp. C2-6-R+9]MEC5413935.1 HAMP domain-containing sensor histidine kinase [Aurantimonas sp. C2-4-R8]